jgi:hypothetical protein
MQGPIVKFPTAPRELVCKVKESGHCNIVKNICGTNSASHVDILYIVSIYENIGSYLDGVLQMS